MWVNKNLLVKSNSFCFQLNIVCLIVVFYKMLRMKSMEGKKMSAKIQ